MADARYPALGFDPLPGNPEVALRLADDAREFGKRMTTQADVLRRLAQPDGWAGEAAEAFTAGLKDLPSDLEICGEAFTGLAGALTTFHERFVAAKAHAVELDERATTARSLHDQALAVYEAPSFQPAGAPPVVRDRRPVDTAERNLDTVLNEAERLRDAFDDSVSDLVRTIYALAQHAPREPMFDTLTRWAGDVFAATPVGLALKAVHELINAYPELFADIANFASALSNVLSIAALPLFIVPGLGQFLAVAALGAAGVTALLRTSLFVGHAVDANGKAYVSGGDLRDAWVDVAFGAAGVGAAAKANQLIKVADGVPGARGGAGFGREMLSQLRPNAAEAWTDARRLGTLRQELGTRGGVEWLAGLSKRRWDLLVPGAQMATGGGVFIDVVGPMASRDWPLGVNSVVALPGEFFDMATDAPDRPDLRANAKPGTPGYAEFTAPGSEPKPVMGD